MTKSGPWHWDGHANPRDTAARAMLAAVEALIDHVRNGGRLCGQPYADLLDAAARAHAAGITPLP